MRHPQTPFEREVVIRRIDRPVEAVPLPEPTSFGSLRLTGPFTRDRVALTPTWRAPARVGGAGVDVEVAGWSDRASELRVRPRSRRLHLWSARRRRRYFAAAHDSADELAAALRTPRLQALPSEAGPRTVEARRPRHRATA